MDIKDDVCYCVNQAHRLNLETLIVNTTRPDVPLQTVKVIVPGLAHFWPQLGNKRLYRVPQTLGWIEKELKEEQLNPLALLV